MSASVDKNGIAYVQPLAQEGYGLSYSNESWTFNHNFRSDGSMRCDFLGSRDSAIVAGYFKVKGPDAEEISGKMNGGPHNDTNPEYADTMDLGITNFLGTKSRVRWEKTHPNYSSSISPTDSDQPIGDVRNKWVGAACLKINLDTNGDGQPDKVALIGMIDPSGLDANLKPVNNWKIPFKRIFSPSEIGLKSIFTPYVTTIGHPELAHTTMRIDQQVQSEWQSSNPPWKFVTCKTLLATKIGTVTDTTAPTIVINKPMIGEQINGPLTGVMIPVSGTVSDASGIALVEVALDAGAFAPATLTNVTATGATFAKSVTITTGGLHTITVRATDRATNIASAHFIMDSAYGLKVI